MMNLPAASRFSMSNVEVFDTNHSVMINLSQCSEKVSKEEFTKVKDAEGVKLFNSLGF